jgi:hypothetical protein
MSNEVVRMMRTTTLFGCAVLFAAGCASQGGYRPAVDPYNDPRAEHIERDQYECREIAKEASQTGKEVAKGAVVGGLLGAATGAAIGAAAGNPGMGAAVGAGAGGMGGGTYTGLSAEERFKRTYENCMRNRGHNVLD